MSKAQRCDHRLQDLLWAATFSCQSGPRHGAEWASYILHEPVFATISASLTTGDSRSHIMYSTELS